MSAPTRRDPGPSILRLPGPGEDATPFMVRCCVKRGSFRSLQDFEGHRVKEEEYKLYVWRSASLRDVAALLHVRDARISSPLALHDFRLVYFDHGQFRARHVAAGVTRLSAAALRAAVDEVADGIKTGSEKANGTEDVEMTVPSHILESKTKDSTIFDQILQRTRPEYPKEADEEAGRTTLDDIGYEDGQILDIVIREPRAAGAKMTLSIANAAARRGSSARGGRQAWQLANVVPSADIPADLHPWNPHGRSPPARQSDRMGEDEYRQARTASYRDDRNALHFGRDERMSRVDM